MWGEVGRAYGTSLTNRGQGFGGKSPLSLYSQSAYYSGSLVVVLLKFSSDSNSGINLKTGQYLMKLRRTKNVPILGHV